MTDKTINEKRKKKLAEQVLILFKERGIDAFEMAKKAVLQEKIAYKPLHDVLNYFIQENWRTFQHPALISLTCEAVGGNPKETTAVGAAMILLAGAADVHDDIIDQSVTKGLKETVFGKFGKDLALLVGDSLIFKGLVMLHEACEKFPVKTKKAILELTREAFFELESAEAKEAKFKGNLSITPEEYWSIVQMKASITDAYARIGAIIGGGNPKQIEALGNYGRTFGVLTTLREDFIDIFEPDELQNRFKNECLPLPLLYAIQDKEVKREIIAKLEQEKITEEEAYTIVELVWDKKPVQNLIKQMHTMAKRTKLSLKFIKKPILHKEFALTIEATIEDIK
ncbi:MAG: polyprenyl synthetase family protein [Candidatus Bathyarchaeales archaeon]